MTDKQIFIGGSGRCGTAVVGQILSQHPDVFYFPEPRFLSDQGGLNDYLCAYTNFRHRMRGRFRTRLTDKLDRRYPPGNNKPAKRIYSPAIMMQLFDNAFTSPDQLLVQAGQFVDNLFSIMAERNGKKYWAEKTPHTVKMVNTLYAMFPNMRYVHILREPKDVCCSVVGRGWGVESPQQFVHWYNKIMEQAYAAQEDIPSTNYYVMCLETLVAHPRRTIRRLLHYLNLDYDDAAIKQYAQAVILDRSHVGRWKRGLTPEDAWDVTVGCYPIYFRWRDKIANYDT